jgi:hypothetical protein
MNAGLIWSEASPKWGYSGLWPSDAEYRALREAKAQLDAYGPNEKWCDCGTHCRHDHYKDWRACVVWEEPHDGMQKMAAVRNFRNRGYSYESELYVSPCAGHRGRFSYLKCWHGVPLRAEVMPPEQSEIQPRQKLMMHRLPDLVIDHGLCDGRDPQDSQVARLLSRLGR